MTFEKEKRLLLGALAMLAPVPLVFNGVLEPFLLAAFLAGSAFFLIRARYGHENWLRPWAMNVLGLIYLPFFLFDLWVLSGGRLVRPVVHLGLFLVLVKLFSLRREVDKWQTTVVIFFLFLAAMATSVHPSIVVYLAAFGILACYLLSRFAYLHLVAGYGAPAAGVERVPFGGFVTLSLLVTSILAIPLFALLPRVRTPYIFAQGLRTASEIEAMGFSDEVTLDSIGAVRDNREVALRLDFGDQDRGDIAQQESFRLKAGTFEFYDDGVWTKTPFEDTVRTRGGGLFSLADEKPDRWVTIYQRPLSTRSLVVPVEAVRIEAAKALFLYLDRGGALRLRYRPRDVFEFKVGLAQAPVSLARAPDLERAAGPLDLTGLSPRMMELAADVMGEGAAGERARRLELYLTNEFEYTLDFVGRSKEDSLENFLFRYRSGHCEYFASAMVLLLRAQGIPARLVTGFLGAEFNPFERYFIVRQGNAHAWVEAYIEDELQPGGEWRIFDPTPAIGRPAASLPSFFSLLTQTYDFLLFRWDRYVLTFGLGDQLDLVLRLRELWKGMWESLRRPAELSEEPDAEIIGRPPEQARPQAPRRTTQEIARRLLTPVLVAVLILVIVLLLRRARPLTATTAYRRLRGGLKRTGVAVGASDPPVAVRDTAARSFPDAAEPTAKVVDLYLQESFAQRALEEAEREELKEALGEALRNLRKAG